MIHSRNIQPQFHNSNDGTCIPSQQEEVSICMFKDLIGFYICVEDTESKMCAQHLLLCLSEHFRHQKRARLIFGGNGSKKTFRKKNDKWRISVGKHALRMNACDWPQPASEGFIWTSLVQYTRLQKQPMSICQCQTGTTRGGLCHQ